MLNTTFGVGLTGCLKKATLAGVNSTSNPLQSGIHQKSPLSDVIILPPFARNRENKVVSIGTPNLSTKPEHGIFTIYEHNGLVIPVMVLFDLDPHMTHIVDIRHHELPGILSHLPAHLRLSGHMVIDYGHLDRYVRLGGGFVRADYLEHELFFFGQSDGGTVPTSLVVAAFCPIGYSISFGPKNHDVANPNDSNIQARAWYSEHGFALE